MPEKADRFVIIGAGRVGTAVAHLLESRGEKVAAVASRSPESLERARRYVRAELFTQDVVKAGKSGNVILVTTPDDLIEDTCLALSSGGALKKGDRVVHMSGALGLDILSSAEERGAKTACIHPLQTFADVKGAIKRLPGSVFAVTARDREMSRWAEELVRKLGGEPVPLAEEHKVLYHIGAVVACNLLVALEHAAELAYQEIGMEESRALKALMPLIEGTVENLKRLGTGGALTGPVARGDIGVLRRHLEFLEKEERKNLLRVYVALSLYALDLAEANLSRTRSEEIERLLRKYI
jgi:predicted short-subunit dehydrogenase-like oxidoreductase (DUF2520 family)